jgi:parallel beta-helix repeat protein
MSKTLAVTIISALIISAIAIVPCIRFASAQTNYITINADGSITPSNAPIQRLGDLYVLTGNMATIYVEKSNLILDGNGYILEGEAPDSTGPFSQTTNYGGIYLERLQNVTVKGFSIKYCQMGVDLDYCSNIVISGNNISGIWHPLTLSFLPSGITIRGGGNNIVTGNIFENNNVGIFLWEDSKGNIISENTISGNTYDGIRLAESSGNTFYHNNFVNTKNIFDYGWEYNRPPSYNIWDNGVEGNFWNNYNGSDSNKDGIGDTAHMADTHNKDRYPLMEPFNSTYYLLKVTSPKIAVLSPINQIYNDSNVILDINLDKAVNWTSFSLDGQDNQTFTGNITLSEFSNGSHNVTVYAQDTFGNIGSSETISFTIAKPESESFPVVPIAAVSTLAVALVAAGLLVYRKKHKTTIQINPLGNFARLLK